MICRYDISDGSSSVCRCHNSCHFRNSAASYHVILSMYTNNVKGRDLFLSCRGLSSSHYIAVCGYYRETSHLYRVNNNIHGFGKRPPDLKGHRVNHHSYARKRKRMSWGTYQGTSRCSSQIYKANCYCCSYGGIIRCSMLHSTRLISHSCLQIQSLKRPSLHDGPYTQPKEKS